MDKETTAVRETTEATISKGKGTLTAIKATALKTTSKGMLLPLKTLQTHAFSVAK